MTLVVTKRPWPRQPYLSSIRSSHYAPRILWCVGAGSSGRDVIAAGGPLTNSGTTRAATSDGIATRLGTTVNNSNYLRYRTGVTLDGPFSLIVRLALTAGSSGSASNCIWNTNANDSTPNSLSLRMVGTGGNSPRSPFGTIYDASTGVQVINTGFGAAAVPTSGVATVFAIHDGTNLTTYVNNTQAAQGACSIYPGKMAQPITLGAQGNGGQGAAADIMFGCLMKGALSSVERAAFVVSPWWLFDAPPSSVFYSLASTAPTLSAAGVTSITSTGATPVVTLTF